MGYFNTTFYFIFMRVFYYCRVLDVSFQIIKSCFMRGACSFTRICISKLVLSVACCSLPSLARHSCCAFPANNVLYREKTSKLHGSPVGSCRGAPYCLASYQFRILVKHQLSRTGPPQNQYISIRRRQRIVRVRPIALHILVPQHANEDDGFEVWRVNHANVAGRVVEILQLLGEGP